jgi:very-short-patch-repair endonuclease
MPTLLQVMKSFDGIAQTQELAAAGFSGRFLTSAVRLGILFRARQGWYATPEAPDAYVRAVRVGGRLAGPSAAASYGLATPHEFQLHVHVGLGASRLRSQHDRRVRLSAAREDGTVIHRDVVAPPTPSTRLRVPVLDCLLQVIRAESEDDAVACLDSALRQRLIDDVGLESLLRRLPERLRYIVQVADSQSDSYPESVARRRLARAGIPTRTQVGVLDERWIDLLIGDRLALEIDGAGKYSEDLTPEAVARKVNKDRLRDAYLEALGYHVIRLSYWMVVFDWPATLDLILAVMERNEHLARSKFMRA